MVGVEVSTKTVGNQCEFRNLLPPNHFHALKKRLIRYWNAHRAYGTGYRVREERAPLAVIEDVP